MAAAPSGTLVIRGTVHQAFQDAARKYAGNEFLCVLPVTAQKYAIEPQVWSYE